MYGTLGHRITHQYIPVPPALNDNSAELHCDWVGLRGQLLAQWAKLTPTDLDEAGPNRRRIAQVVQQKYGIAAPLVENYLANLERTLPVEAETYRSA